MKLLRSLGFCIPPDRLHMLPGDLYDHGTETDVEMFKWKRYEYIKKTHGSVLARFGDKMWDVAHIDDLHTRLKHVQDRDAYLFFDPRLGGVSYKLPAVVH